MIDIQSMLPRIIETARTAGSLIMRHYKTDQAVYRKEDASPVTEADHRANKMIVESLRQVTPDLPIVSEEGEKPDVSGAEYFWLVDPLDGTKSFIRGSGYFTVNIALVKKESNPVLGVIYDPANKIMYYGTEAGAFREKEGSREHIHVRPQQIPMTALISHSQLAKATEEYLLKNHITERLPYASSIKLCMLAEGKADVYPRFAPTMEWDIAAGHAILKAAGGKITTPEGKPFLYGKEGFKNGSFIASS